MMIKKKNKKGQVGLDTAQSVFLGVFIIGVLAIASFLALTSIGDATKSVQLRSETIVNESITSDNVTASVLSESTDSKNYNFLMTISPEPVCYNNTGNVIVPTNNYTSAITGTILGNSSACGEADDVHGFCGYTWNCTYVFSFTKGGNVDLITDNLTIAEASFFENTGTIFQVLIAVVLISAVAIIVLVIRRFRSAKNESGL